MNSSESNSATISGNGFRNSSVTAVPDGESLSQLLDRWKSGDQAAASQIYARYEDRIIQLAQREIGAKFGPKLTAESVALLALESLLIRIPKADYKPDASGSLWMLVRKIVINTIRNEVARWTTIKHNVDNEVRGESFSRLTSREPLPEAAVILADELNRIRELVPPQDFEILAMRNEGLGNPEIADRLGVTRQTVTRKVKDLTRFLTQRAKSSESV